MPDVKYKLKKYWVSVGLCAMSMGFQELCLMGKSMFSLAQIAQGAGGP